MPASAASSSERCVSLPHSPTTITPSPGAPAPLPGSVCGSCCSGSSAGGPSESEFRPPRGAGVTAYVLPFRLVTGVVNVTLCPCNRRYCVCRSSLSPVQSPRPQTSLPVPRPVSLSPDQSPRPQTSLIRENEASSNAHKRPSVASDVISSSQIRDQQIKVKTCGRGHPPECLKFLYTTLTITLFPSDLRGEDSLLRLIPTNASHRQRWGDTSHRATPNRWGLEETLAIYSPSPQLGRPSHDPLVASGETWLWCSSGRREKEAEDHPQRCNPLPPPQ